ncbi:hypothetical protein [Ensifer canadensis]
MALVDDLALAHHREVAENLSAGVNLTSPSVGVDISRLVEMANDLKISSAFPEFAADLFRNAAEAGYRRRGALRNLQSHSHSINHVRLSLPMLRRSES